MAYFRAHPDSGVTRPDQIAIVGDRLSTDIMMANMMGGYGLWIRDGVQGRGFVSASARREHRGEWLHRIAVKHLRLTKSQFARVEDRLQNFLFRRGYAAPDPSRNQFE